MNNNQNGTTGNRNNSNIWAGILIGGLGGLAIGGGVAFGVTRSRERSMAREEMKRVRRHAYSDGWESGRSTCLEEILNADHEAENDGETILKEAYDAGYEKGAEDATLEAQKWIDQNVLIVDGDKTEDIQKAVDAKKKADEKSSKTMSETQKSETAEGALEGQTEAYSEGTSEKPSDNPEAVKRALEGQIEAFPEGKSDKSDNNVKRFEDFISDVFDLKGPGGKNLASDSAPNATNFPWQHAEQCAMDNGQVLTFRLGGSKTMRYPKGLFFDEKGEPYGEVRVRSNLKAYETNKQRLALIWMALGFGRYYPDEDDADFDPGNPGNLNIDEDEAEDADEFKNLGDEPMEATLDRQRYLDQVDKYRNNPDMAPQIISRDDFDEEAHLEQRYFNYYETDNVFSESDDNDNEIDDPMTMFGVTNGMELFKNPDRDDPEVVHVRNMKMDFVAEITKFPYSYASIKDGSGYMNGGTI